MHPVARTVCRTVFIAVAALIAVAPESLGDPGSDGQEKQLAGLRKRAEQGHIEDEMKLGRAYLTGKGAQQNLEESAHWFKRAAELGNPRAQNVIGYFYQRGIGVRADQDRALHWFRMSSAAGFPSAKVNLGIMYLRGEGVHRDYSMARNYFERATEKGSGLGAAYLGDMEFLGLGCKADPASAEKWYEKGVKLHDPVAAYDLAYLYSIAPNHEHKFTKAVRLLRQAIGKGFNPAKHALAFLLLNHPELGPSGREAHTLLQQASDGGQWRASSLLGVLARDGHDGPVDSAQAYYYFHLAARQGGDEALNHVRRELELLAAKLSKEQRGEAEARAEALFQRQRRILVYQSDDEGTRAMLNVPAPKAPSTPERNLPAD